MPYPQQSATLGWLPRIYSNRPAHNLVVYLAVLSIVAIAAFTFRIPYAYVLTFIFASTWYVVVSRRLSDTGVTGLDAISTSELVIACGIASLLLHVAIAGAHISDGLAKGKELSEQAVHGAARIFAEGLVCAAVAPVIAVVIRVLAGGDRAAAGISSPADVGSALDEFVRRSAGMAQNMDRLSHAIALSADRYEGAAVRVSIALEGLAADIQAKTNGLGSQLSALQSQAKVLSRSMAEATTEVEKVGREASTAFGTINESLQSLGALVDGLHGLIGSVNRFIRPDTTADPDSKPPR